MSNIAGQERDDRDLAGEYVLGVLDGAERRQVERRAETDMDFAQEIERWARRLGPLAEVVEPVAPPARVWDAIDDDLARVTRPAPAVSVGTATRPSGRRLVSAVWQWLALGGLGLAAASLAALAVFTKGDLAADGNAAPAGRLTATLASPSGQALLAVVVDRASGKATLIPVGTEPAGGRVPELWYIPSKDAAPRSLGVIDGSQPLEIQFGNRDLDNGNAALAISLEPTGGSPTGAPTGPVIASGPLRDL